MEFVINASHSEVLGWLSRASIGLSTMVDEHFGINVVEFMVRLTSLCVPGVLLIAPLFRTGRRPYPSHARFRWTVE